MWHFYKTPAFIKKIYPSLIWQIDTQSKDLYLTFDDGPIPRLTSWVLNELSSFNAKATFFCVGDNIRKHPDEFLEVVHNGHAIGNHTFNHIQAWKTDQESYLDNVKKCDEVIEKVGIKHERFFRPPHGQITPGLIGKLKRTHRIIMWDVLTYDFSPTQKASYGLSKSISKTDSGSIVVFHDNYKAESKLKQMLPGFLEHFSKQDYNFKNLAGLDLQ